MKMFQNKCVLNPEEAVELRAAKFVRAHIEIGGTNMNKTGFFFRLFTLQDRVGLIFVFPSAEFSVYVLMFYTLKSVRRKASVHSMFAFSKPFLRSVPKDCFIFT